MLDFLKLKANSDLALLFLVYFCPGPYCCFFSDHPTLPKPVSILTGYDTLKPVKSRFSR